MLLLAFFTENMHPINESFRGKSALDQISQINREKNGGKNTCHIETPFNQCDLAGRTEHLDHGCFATIQFSYSFFEDSHVTNIYQQTVFNCIIVFCIWIQLFLPECTGLTPEGVIRAVKTLSENHHSLKSLRIHGIYNIKKDHLDTIRSYFQMKLPQQEHQRQQPILFHHRNSPEFRNEESNPMIDIDVDICPKCNNVSMVYDCPRETCKKKSCKACNLCIPRCEECGECIIESEELEATACGDNLCSNCWLQLPKCNFCNQPYCKLHINHQHRLSSSTGFVCDACHVKFVAMLGACYC